MIKATKSKLNNEKGNKDRIQKLNIQENKETHSSLLDSIVTAKKKTIDIPHPLHSPDQILR